MNIEIYSKPDCPYCDRAVFIAQQIIQETTHIKYEKKMLDEDFTFEEYTKMTEEPITKKSNPEIYNKKIDRDFSQTTYYFLPSLM